MDNLSPTSNDYSDTFVNKHSIPSAYLALGGILEAVDKVSTGEWKNAFAVGKQFTFNNPVRPPGHHSGHKD